MLKRIAIFSIRRRRAVLACTLLLAVGFGVFGATAATRLLAGGFVAPDAESTRAGEYLNEHFGGVQPNLVITVTAPDNVNSPQAKAAGDALVATLTARGDVSDIQSFWSAPLALRGSLQSKDGATALVLGHIGGDETRIQKVAKEIGEDLPDAPDIVFRVGGYAASLNDANTQIAKDLVRAEALALPLAALVLILVFGSVVAATLPLAVGLFSIVSTLAILRAFTSFTDVSIFALNMTTALGLAVAIDYTLFIVSRYREEVAAGADYETAALTAVRTAGRTVWFSAIAVGIGLSAMLVYPMYFLKSLAYTGLAVVFAAALASIVITPALLVALGPRIDALDLGAWLRRVTGRPERTPLEPEQTRWYRTARAVMRRPIPVAAAIIALLLLLGAPFLSLKFGYPDDRMVHAGASQSREVGDILRTDFTQNAEATTYAVLPGYSGSDEELSRYASRLSQVHGVSAVLSSDGVFVGGQRAAAAPLEFRNDAGATVAVATALDPNSDAAERQVAALRAIPAPGEVMFAGNAVTNKDFVSGIVDGLPLVGLTMTLSTLIVLFLFTGSLVLPIKALVINVLSLTAAFGAMVWIFQEGHLSGVLGFSPTGYLAANIPVLMFCLVFGMSMDYEVFLLSRIREEWLASGRTAADNVHSVAMGIARTGRIFTAAAALMAIVLGGMVVSKVTFIQMFGLGLALTALVDATLIRFLLVPSFMRLAGRYNWWAPKPLRALHDRIGFAEAESAPARPTPPVPDPAEGVTVPD